MFVVSGGIYKDPDFKDVEPGTEEFYGPFDTYEEALTYWKRYTFNTKLNCCSHRLFLQEITNPCAEIAMPRVERYRHKKRGSEYTIVGEVGPEIFLLEGDTFLYPTPLINVPVTVQRSKSIRTGPIVVYQCDETYKLWGRPKDEFYDGRFEKIA